MNCHNRRDYSCVTEYLYIYIAKQFLLKVKFFSSNCNNCVDPSSSFILRIQFSFEFRFLILQANEPFNDDESRCCRTRWLPHVVSRQDLFQAQFRVGFAYQLPVNPSAATFLLDFVMQHQSSVIGTSLLPIVDLWSGILCTFSSTELATLQFSSFISSRIRFWSTFHQNFHQICNYSSDEYSLIFRVGRKCIRSYGLEVYAQIQRVLLLISYFLSTVIYTSRQI